MKIIFLYFLPYKLKLIINLKNKRGVQRLSSLDAKTLVIYFLKYIECLTKEKMLIRISW